MNNNKKIIVEFIKAWSRLNTAELTSYFSEDGVYYNIPTAPVSGKEAIESFINSFTATWKETNWDIINIVSENNIVIAERLDRTQTTDDKTIELPCVGVFEMENGKIKLWRDYFDLGTYLKAFE
jgi:limonene-1,2-epoxide hydrolase